jgi:hypothetical protein
MAQFIYRCPKCDVDISRIFHPVKDTIIICQKCNTNVRVTRPFIVQSWQYFFMGVAYLPLAIYISITIPGDPWGFKIVQGIVIGALESGLFGAIAGFVAGRIVAYKIGVTE